MSTKKKAQIKINFKNAIDARLWLDSIKALASFLAVETIKVVKNAIVIVYTAAANALLIEYGKFKDRLPFSLHGASSYSHAIK